MLMHYGCLPPWLKTTKNLTCETDIKIKDNKLINGMRLTNLFYGLQSLEMYTFLPEKCPKPCTSLDIKVRISQSGSNMASRAKIDIWKSDQVYVLKKKVLYK